MIILYAALLTVLSCLLGYLKACLFPFLSMGNSTVGTITDIVLFIVICFSVGYLFFAKKKRLPQASELHWLAFLAQILMILVAAAYVLFLFAVEPELTKILVAIITRLVLADIWRVIFYALLFYGFYHLIVFVFVLLGAKMSQKKHESVAND